MTPPEHEVYAIRYALHERRARENFHLPVVDRPMPMDYFVWLVRGEGRTLVVDTGFGPEAAERRQRRLVRPVVDGLRAMGVDPAAVEDVVLTHLHYDHAGNLPAFERARFHLQEAEMAYATGPAMALGPLGHAFDPEDVAATLRRVFAGRVRFHDGDAALSPGVTLHRIGGHTRGLQAVSVTTARGLVVLASDAAHYWANVEERNPFPIHVDLQEMMTGWDRLRGMVASLDHFIPGHDPAVLARFPHPPGEPDVACLHLPPAAR